MSSDWAGVGAVPFLSDSVTIMTNKITLPLVKFGYVTVNKQK